MIKSSMKQSPHVADSMITERDFATRFSVSTAMAQKMRREGTGPAFVRIGKAVRYSENAVATWVANLAPKK